MKGERLSLPEADWPAADHAMWSALVARGGPLDDRGPLAHLRAASVTSFKVRYGHWLGWLARGTLAGLFGVLSADGTLADGTPYSVPDADRSVAALSLSLGIHAVVVL